MKWLRLLGGWHFIAATAIKPPKAACQFAADDILLYKICYNIQWIYFTIWEKGKEELSPLQYHFKSLHIISRHYKKSLLRSQIYHGYEELSTDTNYPIWRRQKLPYMKKTRKKKQVCGAACFMAAEIKFSEDVRPSVCHTFFDYVPIILSSWNFQELLPRARHLFFPQLGSRTTIKQYGLVRNRNLLGHDDDILPFSIKKMGRTVCLYI